MEVDHKLLTDSMAPPTDELLRYWSLTIEDLRFVSSTSTLPNLRVWVGLQICFLKKRGALARYPSDFPADAIPWMNRQFSVSPLSQLQAPHRPATWSQQREALVTYLGWREFEDCDQDVLGFVHGHVLNGKSRTEIINDLPKFLHRSHIVKPASQAELERHAGHLIERSTLELEILINRSLGTDLCIQLETIITGKFELNPAILDELMRTIPMPSRKNFKNLVTIEKAIRPIARLCREGTLTLSRKLIEENAESVRRWSIWEVKRFSVQKRHMVLACFIIDAHSKLLDSLVHMFDRLVNNREAKLEKSWHQVIIRQQERSRDNRRLILRAAELFANSKPEELLASHSAFDLGSLRKALDDKASRLDNDEEEKAQLICGLARKFRSILRLFLELDPHISESYKNLAQALRLAGDLKGSIVPSEYPNFIDKKFRQTAHSPCGNWRRDLWEWFLVLELKTRLRSQDVYFPESIRSRGFWQVVGGSKTSEPGGAASQAKVPAVDGLLKEFNNEFNLFRESLIENRFVRIDKGELRLSRDPANATTVPAQVMARVRNGLGRIRIEDLFREIDAATNFSGAFRHHATGEELSSSRRHALHATLIAHATNLGLSAMASAAEGVSAEMLENVARGYHSNDCLREAMRRVIDYQASLEAGNRWGIGDISSSDGQLFGVRGKSLAAEYHPRRFGWLKRGVNVYSHISDRYTVFSSQVLSCSVREWIAVLDGLMENDTVLRPKIHTTDTHGYTDHMFALSFLLGFTFAPRIKDAGGTRLWLPEGFDPGDLESIFQHKKISLHELSENWDQIQRIISALKQKLIDGRTLCMRLANSPTDPVSSALLSAGRIIKTTFLLRWMRDHSFRLALHAQLNKGESRQELARNVNFASGSGLRSADHNDLMHRTSALALVCNIIVAWNTKAIGQLIDEMRAKKTADSDLDFSSISPLLHSHIIRTGTYVFRQEGTHVGTH